VLARGEPLNAFAFFQNNGIEAQVSPQDFVKIISRIVPINLDIRLSEMCADPEMVNWAVAPRESVSASAAPED
jgi:hypothetical protein